MFLSHLQNLDVNIYIYVCIYGLGMNLGHKTKRKNITNLKEVRNKLSIIEQMWHESSTIAVMEGSKERSKGDRREACRW